MALTCQAQKTKTPAKPVLTIEECMAQYKVGQARSLIENEMKTLKRRRKPTDALEEKLDQLDRLELMMRATEDVVVIDSVVVDKALCWDMIKLSEESGQLLSTDDFWKRETPHGGMGYMLELGNRFYYSDRGDDARMHLYMSEQVGGQWTEGRRIAGLEGSRNANYPFMMSDGVTLYYGAQSDESIGGYDIFMTRYDADENRFLEPENVGMPFNSPYNDYLLALDESSNLGWLVTDRRQPEGKVCIYVFVPNAGRRVLDADSYDEDELAGRAMLMRIADTQADKEAVADARQRLEDLRNAKPKVARRRDFELVVDDGHTYYMYGDFKSAEARKRMEAWVASCAQHECRRERLDAMRARYAQTRKDKRATMAKEILKLEEECGREELRLHEEQKQIRKTEIAAWRK